jgi:hypothetical protein
MCVVKYCTPDTQVVGCPCYVSNTFEAQYPLRALKLGCAQQNTQKFGREGARQCQSHPNHNPPLDRCRTAHSGHRWSVPSTREHITGTQRPERKHGFQPQPPDCEEHKKDTQVPGLGRLWCFKMLTTGENQDGRLARMHCMCPNHLCRG